jgi:hypothetical protein
MRLVALALASVCLVQCAAKRHLVITATECLETGCREGGDNPREVWVQMGEVSPSEVAVALDFASLRADGPERLVWVRIVYAESGSSSPIQERRHLVLNCVRDEYVVNFAETTFADGTVSASSVAGAPVPLRPGTRGDAMLEAICAPGAMERIKRVADSVLAARGQGSALPLSRKDLGNSTVYEFSQSFADQPDGSAAKGVD